MGKENPKPIVRIHGEPNMELIKEASIRYLQQPGVMEAILEKREEEKKNDQ